jgi:hypothetical protein
MKPLFYPGTHSLPVQCAFLASLRRRGGRVLDFGLFDTSFSVYTNVDHSQYEVLNTVRTDYSQYRTRRTDGIAQGHNQRVQRALQLVALAFLSLRVSTCENN